jgi:NO-binding membrane sensor protein with MHYT domain
MIDYNPSIVTLSFFIAFLGSYGSITACEQYRLTRIGITQSQFLTPSLSFVLMSVSLGGVGIFCMHFIGMSSLSVEDKDGNIVPIRYNTGLTILSLLSVLIFSAAGFKLSSYDTVFMKTKKEIMNMFLLDAKNMSMQKVKNISHFEVVQILATTNPQYLLAGGLVTGSGVVVMHYIGMYAMVFPGHIVWDAGIIAASCIIAFIASTAAFWILFRLLSIYPNKENLRILCALTMAIAVCGMHYCGMGAAKMVLEPHKPVEYVSSFSRLDCYEVGIVCAALVLLFTTMFALSDLRNSVIKLSYEISRADQLILHIPICDAGGMEAQIKRYFVRRKLSGYCLGVLKQEYNFQDLDKEDLLDNSMHDDSSVHSRGSVGHEAAAPPKYRLTRTPSKISDSGCFSGATGAATGEFAGSDNGVAVKRTTPLSSPGLYSKHRKILPGEPESVAADVC